MAAPHVSGAAALLLARHRELIGQPERVKQVLCETATDLGRERYFQGHGMLGRPPLRCNRRVCTMLFTLEALRPPTATPAPALRPSPSPPRRHRRRARGRLSSASLRPRLEELRATQGRRRAAPVQLLMISHIDDDHIHGVLDLLEGRRRRADDGRDPSFEILGSGTTASRTSSAAGGPSERRRPRSPPPRRAPRVGLPGLSTPATLVAASVAQGRSLRDAARALDLDVNHPFGGLVAERRRTTVDSGDGLELTSLGPAGTALDDLQGWERDVKRRKPAEPRSPPTSTVGLQPLEHRRAGRAEAARRCS